ncbi:uncharacterized protein LOC110852870 [Folsomia candida]|nr:uncharacterized protein LOC110852870 [Folsomia candida]
MTSVQRFRHIFVVLVATVVFLSTFSITEVNGVLGADPMSLMRIVRELCGSKKDDAFANGFYGCYSLLDEKEKCIFDNCQKSVFGCTLSTVKNIEYSCTVPDKLPVYMECLMNQFKMCARDIVKAVTTINVCQGRLLGLE